MINTKDLHINVDYVLSNVIFVRVETKYVFIEKRAWHTIVRTFLKPEWRCSEMLNKLKSIIFDLYHRKYILGEKLNPVSASNKFLELIEPGYTNLPITTEPEVKVELNDEKYQSIERYVEPSCLENLADDETKHSMRVMVDGYATVVDVIETELNYLASSYEYLDNIIRLIGFGKIRNLLCNYYIQDTFFIRSDLERKFADILYKMGDANILILLRKFKMKSYVDCLTCRCTACQGQPSFNLSGCRFCSDINICTKHRFYDEYCLTCGCINTHIYEHGPRSFKLGTSRHEDIVYFDETGYHGDSIKQKLTDYQVGKTNEVAYGNKVYKHSTFMTNGFNKYDTDTMKISTLHFGEKTESQMDTINESIQNLKGGDIEKTECSRQLESTCNTINNDFNNFALAFNSVKINDNANNTISSSSSVRQNSLDSGFFSFGGGVNQNTNMFFK